MFKDFDIWSGIVGDVVAGSALPVNQSSSVDDAINNYLTKKHILKMIFCMMILKISFL